MVFNTFSSKTKVTHRQVLAIDVRARKDLKKKIDGTGDWFTETKK